MAHQVQLSTEFDVSAVTFSKLRKNKNGGKSVYLNRAGRKIWLQFPYMRMPFGLSEFTDKNTGKKSYSLELSFDNKKHEDPNDETPEEKEFRVQRETLLKKFEELDARILNEVSKNSQEWLGKKYASKTITEADLYKPLVKRCDPAKGDYAPTTKLKIYTDLQTGEFVPKAYTPDGDKVPLSNIEKGNRAVCIVEVGQVWIIDNKFGVTVSLKQCVIEPSNDLPEFAFKGLPKSSKSSDEEEEVEYEEYEEEEVDA
jgi:hypothetical protein